MNRFATFLLTLPILSATVVPAFAQSVDEIPNISSVQRDKGIPNSTDEVKVTFTATAVTNPIDKVNVRLCYSVDAEAPECVATTVTNDTLYTAVIPPQHPEAIVTYWITVPDDKGNTAIAPADTTTFKYFYVVINDRLAIYDIQYTPNLSGASGVEGFEVTLEGMVVADTSDIPGEGESMESLRPLVVIQDGRGPWSGISIPARDPAGSIIPQIAALRRNDMISVRGIIRERNGLTVLTDVTITKTGAPPITLNPFYHSTATIGQLKDGESIEPEKWESMVTEYRDVIVVDPIPDNGGTGEFLVVDEDLLDDATAHASIETDESNAGYTTREPVGDELKIRSGWTFEYIRGVLLPTADGGYKVVPRTAEDYKSSGSAVDSDSPLLLSSTLSVYPNPARKTSIVDVNLSTPGQVTIDIVDATGARTALLLETRRLEAGRIVLPLSIDTMSEGAYFLRLITPTEITVAPIVIVR